MFLFIFTLAIDANAKAIAGKCGHFFIQTNAETSFPFTHTAPSQTTIMHTGTRYAMEVKSNEIRLYDYIKTNTDGKPEVILFDFKEQVLAREFGFISKNVEAAHFSKKEGLLLSHSATAVAAWSLKGELQNKPALLYSHTGVEKIISATNEEKVISFSQDSVVIGSLNREPEIRINLTKVDPDLARYLNDAKANIMEADVLRINGQRFLLLAKRSDKVAGNIDAQTEIGVYNLTADMFSSASVENMLKYKMNLQPYSRGSLGQKSEVVGYEYIQLGSDLNTAQLGVVSSTNLAEQSAFRNYMIKKVEVGDVAAIKYFFEQEYK